MPRPLALTWTTLAWLALSLVAAACGTSGGNGGGGFVAAIQAGTPCTAESPPKVCGQSGGAAAVLRCEGGVWVQDAPCAPGWVCTATGTALQCVPIGGQSDAGSSGSDSGGGDGGQSDSQQSDNGGGASDTPMVDSEQPGQDIEFPDITGPTDSKPGDSVTDAAKDAGKDGVVDTLVDTATKDVPNSGKGACTSMDSQFIMVLSLDPTTASKFNDDAKNCTLANASKPDQATAAAAIGKCLVGKGYPLTPDCAGCFGVATYCIFKNCVANPSEAATANCIANPSGASCLACSDKYACSAAAETCKYGTGPGPDVVGDVSSGDTKSDAKTDIAKDVAAPTKCSPQDSVCIGACSASQCAVESQACTADAKCSNFASCLGGCSNMPPSPPGFSAMCYQNCINSAGASAAKYYANLTCSAAMCYQCAVGDQQCNNDCTSALCTETTISCLADPDCGAIVECLNTNQCQDAACTQDCLSKYPNGQNGIMEISACLNNNDGACY